jgi:hypothetical protein
MKKVLSLLIITVCVIGSCGCSLCSPDPEQIALQHLHLKYDEKFEVITSVGRNWDAVYDEVLCEDSAGRKVTVYISDEDGKQLIQDDYYGTIVHNDYKDAVSSIADKSFSDYKLFSSFMADFYDDNLTEAVPLKKAIEQNAEQFFSQTYFIVKESEAPNEKGFDAMCDNLRKHGLTMYVVVCVVDDTFFDCVDERRDVNEYLPPTGKAKQIFSKTIN